MFTVLALKIAITFAIIFFVCVLVEEPFKQVWPRSNMVAYIGGTAVTIAAVSTITGLLLLVWS